MDQVAAVDQMLATMRDIASELRSMVEEDEWPARLTGASVTLVIGTSTAEPGELELRYDSEQGFTMRIDGGEELEATKLNSMLGA